MEQAKQTELQKVCPTCGGSGTRPLSYNESVFLARAREKGPEFTLPSVAKSLKMSQSTAYNTMGALANLGLITNTGKRIGNGQVWTTGAQFELKVIQQHGNLKHGRIGTSPDGWYWFDDNDAHRELSGPFKTESDARDHARASQS